LKKQVPAEYFLLTFTLPAEFRALAWANQGVVYDLLLQSCWQTVHRFAHNDRQLQGTPGAIAVLHTNTRRLDYHPHAHLVMPAAAVDAPKAANGEPKHEARRRAAICSTRRPWPRSFGRRFWRRSKPPG
jgi:hypothetical protein